MDSNIQLFAFLFKSNECVIFVLFSMSSLVRFSNAIWICIWFVGTSKMRKKKLRRHFFSLYFGSYPSFGRYVNHACSCDLCESLDEILFLCSEQFSCINIVVVAAQRRIQTVKTQMTKRNWWKIYSWLSFIPETPSSHRLPSPDEVLKLCALTTREQQQQQQQPRWNCESCVCRHDNNNNNNNTPSRCNFFFCCVK